jgi:large subunit ribosomal protein L28
MSRRCEICGKGPVRGNIIHRRGQAKKKGGIGQHVTAITPRTFFANLQSVRAVLNPETGRMGRIKVCTVCIKSGRVTKAANRRVPSVKAS